MKLSRILVTIFGAALLMASAAYAGAVNKGTLNLRDKVSVDGQTLKPGNYRVEWNGDGPTVQVKLIQGKTTVASFPAQVTKQPVQTAEDAYVSGPGPDGSPALTQILIAKHDVQLNIENNGSYPQTNTQGGN
jgi:hypothetical protein